MTLAERARVMARRKELYEEKHPETKNGGDRRSTRLKQMPSENGEPVDTFAVSTVAAIGKNERVVRLDVQLGTEITERALDLITHTPLDNTKYLNELIRTPKAEQVARVERDLASPPSRVQPDPDAAYRACSASSAADTDSSVLPTMRICAFELGEAR